MCTDCVSNIIIKDVHISRMVSFSFSASHFVYRLYSVVTEISFINKPSCVVACQMGVSLADLPLMLWIRLGKRSLQSILFGSRLRLPRTQTRWSLCSGRRQRKPVSRISIWDASASLNLPTPIFIIRHSYVRLWNLNYDIIVSTIIKWYITGLEDKIEDTSCFQPKFFLV